MNQSSTIAYTPDEVQKVIDTHPMDEYHRDLLRYLLRMARLRTQRVPTSSDREDIPGLMTHERLEVFRQRAASEMLAPDAIEILSHHDVVARTAGALGAALDDCIQDLDDAGGAKTDVVKYLAILQQSDEVMLEAYPTKD